ncbi:MAG: N-acetylmuramoyl-L-alanine amidase, partial [Acidimicrobiia bacterium]
MSWGSRSRYLPMAIRAGAVAAVAGFAVLAPIRMAEGAPKTRFAVVLASVTSAARVAAAALPEVPPAAGPVVDSPFPLSHVGVRWVGSEDAAVDIRLAGPDGVWRPWRAMPVAHDLEDGDGGPVLSELIRAHGATHAQVRATGDARDVELVVIDTLRGPRSRRLATAAPASAAEEKPPSDGGEDRGPAAATPSSSTTTTKAGSSSTTTTLKPKPKVAQPDIVTRAEWGADESIRKNDQKYAPITKLFVHHTVTAPDGEDPDPAATVRAIYAYHVQGNGWDDIGYNFLIDAEGRVYEGRWARDYGAGEKPTGEDLNDNGVVGAHVLNHNAGSAGVAMLGNLSEGEPTTAAREALIELLAWKADRHGID